MTNQRNFNGTTLSLGNTSQGKIYGMDISAGGAKINVFEPGDVARLYELGTPDLSLNITLRGTAVPTQGSTGTLSITLGNGNTLTVGNSSCLWQCGKYTLKGQFEGMWEGTAEYWPTTPAGG